MNAISKWLMPPALLCGAVCGAQVADALDASAAPSPHAVKTNLPGVYAFTQPPADFNARTASPQELASWGYPPRPDESQGAEALARWQEVVDPRLQRVIPDLVVRENVFHRPAQGRKVASTGVHNAPIDASSSNWSGFVLAPVTGGQPFESVSGRWTVPTVKQAPKTCSGGWDYSSQWVGIDGFSDGDLLQAGSAANVFCDIGNNVAEYFPWIEWLPQAEIVLYKDASTETLEPFAAGDYLIVTVTATNFSGGVSTTGTLSFQDVTQGWTISLSFTAASLGGSEVTGHSAEWIVERTEVDGALATLPDYIADPWYLTKAEDLSSVIYYPGAPLTATAYNVTMEDNNKANVSFVNAFGKDALWFFPEGSAVK